MRTGGATVVVFDLGGVLVEVPGASGMRELADLPSEEATWQRWLDCQWVARFERGECGVEEFADGVVADWQLSLSAEAFLKRFSSWVNKPLAGATELVTEASRSVRVAALSNLNQLHWAHMSSWELLAAFDAVFLSFQLGLVKPDPAIFERVAADLQTPPREIVFIDDNQVNVDGACAAGFHA
jgi:putative hydrolase of the HAD superfamily